MSAPTQQQAIKRLNKAFFKNGIPCYGGDLSHLPVAAILQMAAEWEARAEEAIEALPPDERPLRLGHPVGSTTHEYSRDDRDEDKAVHRCALKWVH